MGAFKKPTFNYPYQVDAQLKALREYSQQPGKEDRAIPPKASKRLLVATWNIANLGVQKRREKDYRLIAEIVSWFDLIAIQETNSNLAGLRSIEAQLEALHPGRYRLLFSDPGGNQERFAIVYDSKKVELLEEVGEVTLPPKELGNIKLPGIEAAFEGFDRNPHVVSLRAGKLEFVLANVHLFFGEEEVESEGFERRTLEAYALGRWADLLHGAKNPYIPDMLALGDFNVPVREPGDPIYDALTKRGLHLPPHSTKVGGSNLNDDAHYDQMGVFPGPIAEAVEQMGVFDFDGAIFRTLWGESEAQQKKFRAYVKYYISDHRPLWAALRI